jgi:hypothetical protein
MGGVRGGVGGRAGMKGGGVWGGVGEGGEGDEGDFDRSEIRLGGADLLPRISNIMRTIKHVWAFLLTKQYRAF